MTLAAASAAGCAFVGSVAQAAVKPLEVAARHPKIAKTAALGAAGATVAANTLFGDEFDGFDDEDDEEDEEEIANP